MCPRSKKLQTKQLILHRPVSVNTVQIPLVQKAGIPTSCRGELNDDVTANKQRETNAEDFE